MSFLLRLVSQSDRPVAVLHALECDLSSNSTVVCLFPVLNVLNVADSVRAGFRATPRHHTASCLLYILDCMSRIH